MMASKVLGNLGQGGAGGAAATKQAGEDLWKRSDKIVRPQTGHHMPASVLYSLSLCRYDAKPCLSSAFKNAELFTMTYGALVVQLIKDYEDYSQVNKQLDKMGHSMGCRIIEDFLARSGGARCSDFRQVAEMLSKVSQHDAFSDHRLSLLGFLQLFVCD